MGAVTRSVPARLRRQAGIALPMVLVFLLVGTVLSVAVLAFARTSFMAGSVYEDRAVRLSKERDALDSLIQTMRTDLAHGVAGDTRTVTVAGITATCTGQPGSGVTSGAGRTDREVRCSTPSIRATYRIFDRSGDRPGIIVETLSSTTLD